MDLYVWSGEGKWGVPSMDLKSLQMLAYVKFSGAPVTIHKTSNPFSSQLPSLKCSEGTLTEFSSVSSFLRKQNYSCDYELSPRQCSDVTAYENLLKTKLYPALVYLWWVEPKSYYDVIHKWFFKNIPFPYKLYYPNKFHKNNLEFVSSLYDEPDDDQIIETEVDLKVSVLQNHIKACPNLSRYVTKILQRYFSSEHKSNPPENQVPIDDVPNKGRNLVISGMIACAAMFGYAVASGLVQVDMGENFNETSSPDYNYEDDYDEYEEETNQE